MGTIDRRSMRTRLALRNALAAKIEATGDLSKVTVTAVTRRADVTRRTFYSHYRDIPALVNAIEDEVIADVVPLVHAISEVALPELEHAISIFAPCPGAEELLEYFRTNAFHLSALLGEGGDPAFVEKLKKQVRRAVEDRARDGFAPTVDAKLDRPLAPARPRRGVKSQSGPELQPRAVPQERGLFERGALRATAGAFDQSIGAGSPAAPTEDRAHDGFASFVEAGFDYYLTFAISAEVGVLVRWLTAGCPESCNMMARIMTILMFIRPGDLYGRPIDFDLSRISASIVESGRESIHG